MKFSKLPCLFILTHYRSISLRPIPKANISKSFYPPALIVNPPNIPYSDNIIIIITVCLLYGASLFYEFCFAKRDLHAKIVPS